MIARRSAQNTVWCLFGCALGDLGTIAGFQYAYHPQGIPEGMWVMVWALAMTAGICTSVLLETIVLWRQVGPPGSSSYCSGNESDFYAAYGGGYEPG